MISTFLASFLTHYQWLPALCGLLGTAAISLTVSRLKLLSPTFRAVNQINTGAFKEKMQRRHYAENHSWNHRWAPLSLLVIFGAVMPFCLTLATQPWWKVALDCSVILMVYDFAYYLTHRFLFHDSAFLGGPLKWMHAVHHRQHNPCRRDSSYIHPLEVAIGLGLFAGTILVLSLVMGRFQVATLVVSWFAFSEINVHNHTLWEADHFPFKYLNYASKMHHNHHAKFTGGNFATISLLYDWMFGTLDNGDGYKAMQRASVAAD
jgi:sterol desaturase/sphingolipid hydroxylase (fatty acid hydroxylase superfamily)